LPGLQFYTPGRSAGAPLSRVTDGFEQPIPPFIRRAMKGGFELRVAFAELANIHPCAIRPTCVFSTICHAHVSYSPAQG
jgi:hypothetical protein